MGGSCALWHALRDKLLLSALLKSDGDTAAQMLDCELLNTATTAVEIAPLDASGLPSCSGWMTISLDHVLFAMVARTAVMHHKYFEHFIGWGQPAVRPHTRTHSRSAFQLLHNGSMLRLKSRKHRHFISRCISFLHSFNPQAAGEPARARRGPRNCRGSVMT